MEMSFLADENFSNVFYKQQTIDLDVGENLLFDRLVSNGKPFDLPQFWDSEDEPVIEVAAVSSAPSGMGSILNGCTSSVKSGGKKEDFNKMLSDWQEHLSSMKVLDGDKFHPNSPDLLSTLQAPNPVSIDELFPEDTPSKVKGEIIEDVEIHSDETKEEGEINSEADDDQTEMNDSGLGKDMKPQKIERMNIDYSNETTMSDTITENRRVTGNSSSILEAGDVASLLEQFEASEMIGSAALTSNSAQKIQAAKMNHQTIRDSLPKEVIERIKASSACKKSITIIPAMPSKRTGRAATRMQDAAATLCRNKLLKIVSGGESVQLDHDYCSGTGSDTGSMVAPPRNFYQTETSDYGPPTTYSRLPDYYVALAPQKSLDPFKTNKDWPEKNSKKDSGLESGDVSDASEEVAATLPVQKAPPPPPPPAITLPSTKNMTMVSVLKRCHLPQAQPAKQQPSSEMTAETETTASTTVTTTEEEPVPRKRKLNLEEYRSRREERERLRSSEDGSRTCSPVLNVAAESSSQPATGVKPSSMSAAEIKMQSVEVQTTPEDIAVLAPAAEGHREATSRNAVQKKSNPDSSRRRREYRSRRVSSSSSSSSDSRGGRSRHRSHRRRKNSNSDRGGSSNSQSRGRSIWSRSRSRSSSSSSGSSCSTCTNSSSPNRSRSPSRSRCSWSGNTKKWRNTGRSSSSSRSLWRTKHRFNRTPSRRAEPWRNHQRTSSWPSNRSRVVGGGGGPGLSLGPGPVQQGEWGQQEKLRQVEERRVIYVGRIDEGTTKAHLRERFEVFGPIIDISVHFREHGDNYGFVTFAYKVDAYEAVEHGNDDPHQPRYDLSFGGRRAFCKQRYADLDGERNNKAYNNGLGHRSNESFDLLLREAQAKLRKRSSV